MSFRLLWSIAKAMHVWYRFEAHTSMNDHWSTWVLITSESTISHESNEFKFLRDQLPRIYPQYKSIRAFPIKNSDDRIFFYLSFSDFVWGRSLAHMSPSSRIHPWLKTGFHSKGQKTKKNLQGEIRYGFTGVVLKVLMYNNLREFSTIYLFFNRILKMHWDALV